MEEFDKMMEGLGLEDPGPGKDLSVLSGKQLMDEVHRVRKILLDNGAMVYPKTEEDVDLQGYYFGLTQEMRKRRML